MNALTRLLPWLLLLATGCQIELPEPMEIQFDRPLGARAEVVDARDPLRATPAPGERVRYEVLLAFDDPVERDHDALTSLFLVCTAPDQFTGIPLCQEFLQPGFGFGGDGPLGGDAPAAGMPPELSCDDGDFAFGAGPFYAACVSGAPALEFPIEEDFTATAKMVIGIVCQGGTPYLDMEADSQQLLRCRDNDGEAMDVYGTVPVWYEPEEPNLNPDLSQLRLTFAQDEDADAEPWVAADEATLPQEGCADVAGTAELPLISADADDPHVIGFSLDPAAITEEFEGEREVLEIAAHATIKGIDRLFTLFGPDKEPDDETGDLEADLDFEVDEDEELQAGGQLVRFYFTARDRRGGFDLIERVACAVDEGGE